MSVPMQSFCLRNVDIWHTLASTCILWFLTWSFLVLPLIHRSILISATCNLFSSFFLTAQHSAPYVIVGLITVLYTLSFSLMGTFLSHSTPVSCFHFIQASLTRLLMLRWVDDRIVRSCLCAWMTESVATIGWEAVTP